jgi:hypothetical protein
LRQGEFPDTFPEMKRKPKSALATHRARLAKQGKVRLEVTVRREDVPLIRDVVTALNDSTRASEMRTRLRSEDTPQGMSFKEWLASGPSFEAMDLERVHFGDRDVDLES